MQLRYKSFRGFFDHFALDIACFQEVKLPAAKMTRELACVPDFQSFWATSTGKTGYSGVTTWCRCPHAVPLGAAADCLGGEEQPELDTEGRLVLTDHGAFVLLNAYVPNAGDRPERARLGFKLAFLAALRRRLDELAAEGRQVIAVGDFNVAMEPRDVHPAIGYDTLYDEREVAALRSLAAAYPDVWRRLHPEQDGAYTVWEERTSARAFNVGLRIDYVFVSPGLLPYVESCEILSAADIPPKWSDHAALLLKLRVRTSPPPPGALPSVQGQQQQEAEDKAAADGEQQAKARGTEVPDAAAGGEPNTLAPAAAPLPRLELPPPAPAPCAMWQATEARFVDRSQRSIRDLFGRRQAKAEPAAAASAAPPGPSATSVAEQAGGSAAAPDVSSGMGGARGVSRKRGATDGEGSPPPLPAPALRPGGCRGDAEGTAERDRLRRHDSERGCIDGADAGQGNAPQQGALAGPGEGEPRAVADAPAVSVEREGGPAAGATGRPQAPGYGEEPGPSEELSQNTEVGSAGRASEGMAPTKAGGGSGAAEGATAGGGRGSLGAAARGSAGRGAAGARGAGRKGRGGGTSSARPTVTAAAAESAGKQQRSIQSFFKGG